MVHSHSFGLNIKVFLNKLGLGVRSHFKAKPKPYLKLSATSDMVHRVSLNFWDDNFSLAKFCSERIGCYILESSVFYSLDP